MSFLMLLLGVLWFFAGLALLFVCVILLIAAGPIGLAMFVALLKFCWWLGGKDWGIARRFAPPLAPRATQVHRKPGKPDHEDPSTYIPHRSRKVMGTSLDDPCSGPFDSFGLR